jgi:hypothetical protein
MITEINKFGETKYIVAPGKNKNLKFIQELLNKIQTKQKEPFAKIAVITTAPYFPIILVGLKKFNIPIKNIATDKKSFVLEL